MTAPGSPTIWSAAKTNLAANLMATAAKHPDKAAIRLDGLELTWSQLRDLSLAAAGSLRAAGVGPGDRVALILPNVPAFPILFFGTLMAGGTAVPMNPLFKAQEIDYYFSDSGAKLSFVWGDFLDEARKGAQGPGTRVVQSGPMGPSEEDLPKAEPFAEPVAREDSDTTVILYTSGTTGRPKGAELTHSNINVNARRCVEVILELSEDDVIMGCLPLFHVFGLVVGLQAATACGAALALIPRFDPGKALEVIGREKVTVFEGVPTMYAAMLHHPDAGSADTGSLRVCASGGSAMPAEVMKAFEEKFGCMILEGYGLSETSPVASFNMPDRERKPGTIGMAIPGCEMKLVGLDGEDVGARRGRRRDRDPGRQRHEGLLEQA